jgi:hypothetical protein
VTQHRGSPGEEGHPGKPGEEGKDTGEGGRGGEGGEGGAGGPGAPQGPGGGGGEGGVGGRGARGATGPAGARGPAGPQPRLRWTPAIGYVLLALVLGFLIYQGQNVQRKSQAATVRYIQRLVLECAQPARLTSAQRRFCVDAIPNYESSQRAAAQRAKDYDSLRRWAISRGWEPPPTTVGNR